MHRYYIIFMAIISSHFLFSMEEEGDLQNMTFRLAAGHLGISVEEIYKLTNISIDDIDTETLIQQKITEEEGYVYDVSLKNNQGKILGELSSQHQYCIRMVCLGDKTITLPLDLGVLKELTNIANSPKAKKRTKRINRNP